VSLSRRELLAGAIALPALPKTGDHLASRLVAQTYIFIQELQKKNNKLAGSQDEIFGTLAKAGFTQAELMSEFFAQDATAGTLAAVKKYNVQVPIVYFGGPMHDKEASVNTYQKAVALTERVRRFGVKAINTNPAPKPRRAAKTTGEMRIEADCLNRIATTLAKANMNLFLHHHDAEMQNAAAEFKYLALKTDASLVKLCIDTHWAFRGGEKPMNILKIAGNRVASLHLRNSHKGIWSETLGDGDVDYRAVAKYLKTARLKPYLVVELAYDPSTQVTRDLAANLKLAREYAEKVFI
jgi:inosose dehydratase